VDTQSDAVTVRVGIFSGRRNPEISLAGNLAQEFARRVRGALGGERVNAAPPARLGSYYGFFVKLPPEMERQYVLPAEISVFQGVVTAGGGTHQGSWRDASELERFLIDLAFEQGHGDLLVRSGVAARPPAGRKPE
jgi:hypothetical protein